jgi:replicative DNA helicase
LGKTQYVEDIQDHILRLKEYATRREIEKALESSLKAIRLDKHVDTSELAQSVSKTILDASSGYFGSDSFVNTNDCVISTIERIVSADMHGTPTGFIGLDHQIGGIQKGDLIIIAGESSGGKSLLASNIAVNLMDETNKPILFYSMEMTKEQVTQRILSSLSSVQINRLRMGTYTAEEWARFQHVSDLWKKRPFYVATGSQTVETIITKTKKKYRELGGLVGIVVDYIQLMKAEKSVGRTGDIDHITRSLKSLALDLDMPVIALSQYKRTGDKKPTVGDLRDSGSIEQDANVIIMINHEETYSELIIGKQREGERNISSKIVMNGAMGRFENPTSTWG